MYKRQVAVAHEDEHDPTGFEPYMTEYGYAMGKPQLANTDGADGDVGGSDETLYDIERIVRADRIGNMYKLWIKWKGYDEVSPRWRHELVKETSNPEILINIDQMVQEAKERHKLEHGSTEADDIDDLDIISVPPNEVATATVLSPPAPVREGPILRRRTTVAVPRSS